MTQGFGESGERGVDLGQPFHTPIGTLQGGTVSEASCGHPWGCEVGIDTTLPGVGPVIEYFLHLDELSVAPGQQVAANQQIGLSGGQLGYGENPNDPSVSTGPHVEVGYFQGQFWGPSFDPIGIVRQGPEFGTGGPVPPVLQPILGGAVGAGAAAAKVPGMSINFDPWGGFQQAVGGFGNWIHDRAVPFAGANLIALVVAAAVILIIFGTGQSGQAPVAPKVVPVPV